MRNSQCVKIANEAEDQRRILFERSELCSRPERSELIQATARVSERRVLPPLGK